MKDYWQKQEFQPMSISKAGKKDSGLEDLANNQHNPHSVRSAVDPVIFLPSLQRMSCRLILDGTNDTYTEASHDPTLIADGVCRILSCLMVAHSCALSWTKEAYCARRTSGNTWRKAYELSTLCMWSLIRIAWPVNSGPELQ